MTAPLARKRTVHYEVQLVWYEERACYALQVFSRTTGDLLDFYPLGGSRFPGFCRAPAAEVARWLRTLVTDMDVEMVIGAKADPFYLEDEGAIRAYRTMRRRGEPISGRRDGQVEQLVPSLFQRNPIGKHRRRPHRTDFWDTGAGTAVQIVAGIGVLAGVFSIVKNWGSPQSTALELPVATTTLLASLAPRNPR